MKKIVFLAGLAIGYVLGARAGRKRYEQIAQATKKLWDSAPVQKGVDQAEGLLQKVAPKAGEIALDGAKKATKLVVDLASKANDAKKQAAQADDQTAPEAPVGTVNNPAK